MTTVLNIQADEQTMLLVHWILSEDGFRVMDALGAPATLARPHQPDVVVINTDMDASEKRVCIIALRELVPGVKILDLGIDAELDSYDTGADHYLNKPFSGHDLIARLRACEA
jgi:DNA-binding response OmpR family regulator